MASRMNKKSQIVFTRHLLRKKGIADDIIDIESEIDSSLHFDENYPRIKQLAVMNGADLSAAEIEQKLEKYDGLMVEFGGLDPYIYREIEIIIDAYKTTDPTFIIARTCNYFGRDEETVSLAYTLRDWQVMT